MWDCVHCLTGRIAASLPHCPKCRRPRHAEDSSEPVSEPQTAEAEPVRDEAAEAEAATDASVQGAAAPTTDPPTVAAAKGM